MIDRVRWVKENFPQVQVIGGNIATAEAALDLVKAGADAVKVGIGPGSICTTRIVAGVGVPQISAIANVSAAEGTGVPMIADGGIRFSGDLSKAIVAGANAIMMGSMFAGTEEAPGEIELFQGRSYKAYRGWVRWEPCPRPRAPRTVTSRTRPPVPRNWYPKASKVVCRTRFAVGHHPSADGWPARFHGLHRQRHHDEMRTRPQFVRITGAGMAESHVHDVQITKEAPNYRVG